MAIALVVFDTAVKGTELYCYNTESDRNSVVSQASCTTDVTHEMSKFTHGEAGGIQRLPHPWQQTVDIMGDYFEDL